MNQEQQPGPLEKPFKPSPSVDALWRHARRRPGQDAVVDSRLCLSFEALRAHVERLARALRELGIGPGEPVVVLFDVCAESVVAFWALRAIDAVVVVGDPTGKGAEIDYYLEVTGSRHVLAGTRAAAALAPPAAAAWHVLEDGAAAAPRRWRLDRRSQPPAKMRGDMAAESRAAVIFSSGTTGKPKAIVHTQDSLRSLHEVLIETWKLSPDDRALGALPFHTIYGLFFSAASIIYAGATLVLVERFRPERVLAAIERHRVTTAAFVPTMALMILNFEDRDGYDLSSLRAVYAASAPISDSDIERFRRFSGAPMIANYGLTEIPGAAVEPADEPHQEGSVGKISPGFEVCVRDSEGRPLPVGETGEITVRGPSQMQGYLGDPAQTAERLRDGWIHTQDIGRVDAAGNIYLSGRTSDMIMRGGLNISPHEVEHALSTHPEVLDSAVVGTPDPIYGEVVTAFVVVRGPADGAAIAKALTDHCRSLLAAAKVPANIVLVDALPRNAGGKVLRKQLQERGVGPADEDEAMDGKGNA